MTREQDELDRRIRALEAERLRPAPTAAGRSAAGDTHAEVNQRARARRIHAATGSLRAVMDTLGVGYAEAKHLTEETR